MCSEAPAAHINANLPWTSADKAVAALHGILMCKAASQALYLMQCVNTAEKLTHVSAAF